MESVIKRIEGVVADSHGHHSIEIELEDGVKGYYASNLDFLLQLEEGMEVSYLGTKEFAGRLKINGLNIIKQKQMADKIDTIIINAGPVQKGNGTYFRELTTEEGVTALYFSKNLSDVELIIKGSRIFYVKVETKKEKDWFVGLEKQNRYSSDIRRNLSITRQSSLKLAIEVYALANPKGRWATKEGAVDIEAAYTELTELADKFVDYCLVE